jgi:hypothetical protein
MSDILPDHQHMLDLFRVYKEAREVQADLEYIRTDMMVAIDSGYFEDALHDAIMELTALIDAYYERRMREEAEQLAKKARAKSAKASVAANVVKLKVKPKRKPKQ